MCVSGMHDNACGVRQKKAAECEGNSNDLDGFVNSPLSALRFSALSLRRTCSTPHSTRFARLELGLFTKPSIRMTFYEAINLMDTDLHCFRG
jgi:hypothetical protein